MSHIVKRLGSRLFGKYIFKGLVFLITYFLLTFLFLKIIPQKASASVLFNITHDANNLDEYDFTSIDEDDLYTSTPGLADTTARMEALIDDTTNIYGQMQQTSSTDEFRIRFYINPNGLSIDDGQNIFLSVIYADDWAWLLPIYLRYSGGTYQIYAIAQDDEGSWDKFTGYHNISDDVHYLEFHLERESSDGSDDGRLRMWIDGDLVATIDDVDNWANFPDPTWWQFGALNSGTARGTIYLDEIVANDDGSEIGPVPGELFNITHEAENLDEYDSTVTDGGDLSTGNPGLINTTAKMEALIDSTTSIYGEIDLFNFASKTQLRWRAYIDISALTMTLNDLLYWLNFRGVADSKNWISLENNASGYQIRVGIVEDAGGSAIKTAKYTITGEHYIEVHLIRPTSDVASDGTMQLWIDGVDTETITGLDFYDNFVVIDELRIGPTSPDLGTSGSLYIDEIKVNDTGVEIGAINPPDAPNIDNFNDGSRISDNSPTLQFDMSDPDSGDIIKYQIQVDDNSGFSSPFVDITESSGSSEPRNDVQYSLANLGDDSYYWRVRAIDDDNSKGSWSTANGGGVAFIVDTIERNPSAPQCTDEEPGLAPGIVSATDIKENSLTLNFNQAQAPVEYYVLEYGDDAGDYKYSADNIGNQDSSSYTVGALVSGATYYFRIRASNGCATGPWSNVFSATTNSPFSSNSDEELITTIVEKKVVPIDEATKEEEEVLGHTVIVKVIDEDDNQVEGAKVTLYSEPKVTYTDNNGVAAFKNVESGEHRVAIEYDGKKGEQNIVLGTEGAEDIFQEISLTIKIAEQNPFSSPYVIMVISVLTIGIIILTYKNLKKKNSS